MIDYFKTAHDDFLKERDTNRVTAIYKANARLKGISKHQDEINELLEEAKNGDFTQLVETFVSAEVAEKYESKKIFSKW